MDYTILYFVDFVSFQMINNDNYYIIIIYICIVINDARVILFHFGTMTSRFDQP